MSVDSQFEGGFSGTRRQGKIHYRLFSLLTGYDGHFRHRNGFVEENTEDALVFSWLTDVNGWDDVDEGVFISLARALPQANFRYYTFMKEEVGGGDESINDIEFENGSLRFRSELVYADEIMYSFEDHDYESMQIDNEGNIVGDEEYLQECIESEKESLAELLALTTTGTDDSARLLDLGMLYETGLAGVEKDLNKAWDCYLKAAAAGDQAAIEFVTEIFSAENRMELRELLTNKCISAESYSVFFDLGSAYNDAELTAKLLDYKKALEKKESRKTFVITGKLDLFENRNEFVEYIKKQGGKVTGSISSNTDYLICNDTSSNSSKMKKAKELGVEVITEEEFIRRFGDPNEFDLDWEEDDESRTVEEPIQCAFCDRWLTKGAIKKRAPDGTVSYVCKSCCKQYDLSDWETVLDD